MNFCRFYISVILFTLSFSVLAVAPDYGEGGGPLCYIKNIAADEDIEDLGFEPEPISTESLAYTSLKELGFPKFKSISIKGLNKKISYKSISNIVVLRRIKAEFSHIEARIDYRSNPTEIDHDLYDYKIVQITTVDGKNYFGDMQFIQVVPDHNNE